MLATTSIRKIDNNSLREVVNTGSIRQTKTVIDSSSTHKAINIKSRQYLIAKHLLSMNYKKRRYDYRNEDVLVCSKDNNVRELLVEYFSRMIVRANDPLDEGRTLGCIGMSSPEEVLTHIVENKKTYGFIVCDLFFDNTSISSREMIRQLREKEYPGCVIYLADSGLSDSSMEDYFMGVGADALLIKGTKTMKIEFQRLVTDLVKRNNLCLE